MTRRALTAGDRRTRLLLLLGSTAAFGFWFGLSMLAVVLSFVVMLVVHELGHFVVARWAGMQVTEAFIGFGPRVWSVQRGETEYGVKAIPAGAYVRITGMTNLDEVEPEVEHRTYRQQSYPRRLAVALAGSATQFLLAGLLLVVIFVALGRPDTGSWVVRSVVPATAAEEAGVLAEDRILSVGGRPVADFDRSAPPQAAMKAAFAGRAHVRHYAGDPAAFPGLYPGDRIVAVDGVTTAAWADVVDRVEVGTPHRLTVRRVDDSVVGVTSAPRRLPSASAAVVGFFGVSPKHPLEPLGPVDGVVEATSTMGDLLWESTWALLRFFTPGGISGFVGGAVESGGIEGVPTVTTSGPEEENRLLSIYGAVRLGDAAFDSGAYNFLWFVVLVNVFVGVFNLVPLLPLDGGHIAIATYERLRSRRGRRHFADAAKLAQLTWVVVTFLLALALIALYRDLVDLPDFG